MKEDNEALRAALFKINPKIQDDPKYKQDQTRVRKWIKDLETANFDLQVKLEDENAIPIQTEAPAATSDIATILQQMSKQQADIQQQIAKQQADNQLQMAKQFADSQKESRETIALMSQKFADSQQESREQFAASQRENADKFTEALKVSAKPKFKSIEPSFSPKR